MKKLTSFFLCLFAILNLSGIGECAWDKSKPAGSDLISDIDTLVIANNTALEETLSGLTGWKNLNVNCAAVTVVTVTADWLLLQGTNTIPMRAESVSETITITTSGASGLDTGAEAASKWYYIWIIAKADGTINGLFSLSSSAPTLPADYVYKTIVGAVYNSSGSDLVAFNQIGRIATFTTAQTAVSGVLDSSVSIAPYYPSGISDEVFGTIFDAGDSEFSYVGNKNTTNNANSLPDQVGGGASGNNNNYWRFKILTADTLWVDIGNASGRLFINGYVVTLI